MRLTLTVPTQLAASDQTTRRVSGLVVPYGVRGRTSAGDVSIRAGALTLPENPARVRLLYGHNHDAPIGAALTLTDTADGLSGEFVVARTPTGDAYLAELDPDAPIRDGLSVELDGVTLEAGEVTAGHVIAVAAVPLPAYTDARATLAAALPEPERTTMTDTTAPAADTTPAPTPEPVTLEAAAVPARPMTAAAPARTAPVSPLLEAATRLTDARLTGNAAAFLAAALADITPAGNGAGNAEAGLMRQALGELWSGVEYDPIYRPLIASGQLTGTKVSGFRWNPAPTVGDYTGNKTAIPSNAAKLEFVEVAPTRLAGGHDIDRIYRDLGDPAVLASYWRRMAESLAVQLDARALALITDAAGAAATPAPTTAMSAIVRGTLAVQAQSGARATFALVAGDLIEQMAETPASDVPVGPPGMTLPPVTPGPDLPAGTVIVGARPAARLLTFEPPVRAEAVNIPNGGIDAALFSYSAGIVENAAGVIAYTVAPAALAARTTAK